MPARRAGALLEPLPPLLHPEELKAGGRRRKEAQIPLEDAPPLKLTTKSTKTTKKETGVRPMEVLRVLRAHRGEDQSLTDAAKLTAERRSRRL